MYYEEKKKSLTLYAMFWMVLIALSSNLDSHACMCVCKFFFLSYRITLLQTNTICSNIYTFGCSLNVRQKERSRSKNLDVKLSSLADCSPLLHTFFIFCSFCLVFSFSCIFTGISNPTVLAPETIMEICIIYGLHLKPNEAY